MYEVIADIRNKPTESLYFVEKSGYYKIISEEYENKVEINSNLEQTENFATELFNSIKRGCDEPTYDELLDKIDKLEIQLARQSDLIELYEE